MTPDEAQKLIKEAKALTMRVWRCPKCGYESSDMDPHYIKVSGAGFEHIAGVYCQRCWASWIAATIPKMQEHNPK